MIIIIIAASVNDSQTAYGLDTLNLIDDYIK